MSTKIESSRPEDDIAEKGLPALPEFLQNDQDAKFAMECIEDLFGQFNQINEHGQQLVDDLNQNLSYKQRRHLHNKTRRQIGPAVTLAMTYLYERTALEYKKDTSNIGNGQFIARFQEIMKLICDDEAVKQLVEPYTWKDVQNEFIKVPIEIKKLPELRAAIATSVIPIDYNWFQDSNGLRALRIRTKTLNLAVLQWTAIKIFVQWKESRGRQEFTGLKKLGAIRRHLASIEEHLADVRSRLDVQTETMTVQS